MQLGARFGKRMKHNNLNKQAATTQIFRNFNQLTVV